MRVIFAGGGTGGHVYPVLAVAEELKSRFVDFEALFVGTRYGLEAKAVSKENYEIEFIYSRGVRGRGIAGKGLLLASIAVGVPQAMRIMMKFKPDLVFGSGGYASAAVVIAASILRRRIVLQEQNSIPGLTNRMLAPKAERIYLGFEKAKEYLGNHPGLKVTGNPLRREILDKDVGNPRSSFGLDEENPVLLVYGGSQGAQSLNRAAVEFFLRNRDVQGIIQTGERNYAWVKEKICGRKRIFVSSFISNINRAYHASDAALARAGALSVSELAAVGLPAVLVPYPHAADNHQVYNARLLVEAGGAVMIRDSDLNGRTLEEALDGFMRSPGRLSEMRKALRGVARKEAASVIADDIGLLFDGPGCGKDSNDEPEVAH